MDLPVERVLRPSELGEALRLLAEHGGARPVAGGTDIVVQLRAGKATTDTLLDLSRLSLAGIAERDGGAEIGAGTTMDQVAASPLLRARYPGLVEAARHVGAWPIQCRATIGGNLANASPAADTAPPLLVAGAVLELASVDGSRLVPLREFFLGPGRTALRPSELVLGVFLPPPPLGRVVERFVKVGPRAEQIISVVSLAARAVIAEDGTLSCVRVALGSVAPTPVCARSVERLLENRRLDRHLRREAVSILQDDIAPIDDLRAPARYRRLAAAVLLDRFLGELDG